MKLTPLKAIKKHCLECSGYEKKEVWECKITDCVLFNYRLGRNPKRTGIGFSKNLHSNANSEKCDDLVSTRLVYTETEN